MKKKTQTKTKTEVASRRAVRELLIEAARRVEVPTDKVDDAALLKAARYAQREAGSFEELFNTVTTVNGTVEVLYQMIRPSGNAPDDVNWTVVCDLLDDARRRLGPVYSATAELWHYERDAAEEISTAQSLERAAAINEGRA